MHLQAVVYRAHDPRWAWTPLSGEGARRRGGRFNRVGLAAIYMSFSLATAVREVSPIGRRMQPLVLCAYEVDANPVFDALDPIERAEQSVGQEELDCSTWRNDMFSGRVAASQALADRLIDAGFAGMRFRSYALGAGEQDINLVLWRWGRELPSRVVLMDEDNRLGS
ncbi:MAG: RES domain-containing protein [Gammaproteobacteria bacterium]|nr:RES domain-containing protein [Gammaproteobacteria bacterium]